MQRWRKAVAAGVATVVGVVGSTGGSAVPAGASWTVVPPVLVTGDSLAHVAEDELRAALAERGYTDVRFAVYGGTTIDWSLDRVREGVEPVVVFATGTMHAFGGWTPDEDALAAAAVSELSERSCAVWVLPEAARYPDGREVADPDAAATVAGIRRALAGSRVQVVDWAEVADALPEIHVWDGVHHTEGGQVLYGEYASAAVASTCHPVDPAVTDANHRYVDAVHRLLLGRAATGDEQVRWGSLLDGGHPRIAFARRLGTTPEWVDGQVSELYELALGRAPEPDGLRYWRDQVVSGTPLAEVAAHVYGSAEARERAGGTDRALVAALYRGLLHREPEADGLAYWTSRMADGMPAPAVARSFHSSLESRRDRVVRLYRAILERDPDPDGLAHWAEALVTVGDLRLAATLAASDEAFQRAQVG